MRVTIDKLLDVWNIKHGCPSSSGNCKVFSSYLTALSISNLPRGSPLLSITYQRTFPSKSLVLFTSSWIPTRISQSSVSVSIFSQDFILRLIYPSFQNLSIKVQQFQHEVLNPYSLRLHMPRQR